MESGAGVYKSLNAEIIVGFHDPEMLQAAQIELGVTGNPV